MIFRVLSALATIALVWVGSAFFSEAGGRAPAICLMIAAALTLLAQWRISEKMLLVAGIASIGGAFWFQPNLAVWFGMFGDGFFAPLQSGRNALALTFAGAWLLLLFGRAAANSSS